ncbi:Uncharacterised protein [Chlamydia trachomatis]|nr:Uncharacterised protein [Chlamydia trachomatis]
MQTDLHRIEEVAERFQREMLRKPLSLALNDKGFAQHYLNTYLVLAELLLFVGFLLQITF